MAEPNLWRKVCPDESLMFLLVDIGVSAGWHGHRDDALTIVEGLRSLQSQPHALLDSLHALMMLRFGNLPEALALVDQCAARAPADAFVKAVKALAYAEDGRPQWRKLAQEVAADDASSEAAREVAGLALDMFGQAARAPIRRSEVLA
jgi:Bacterial type III secretion protein (HrpB1_HrpK)